MTIKSPSPNKRKKLIKNALSPLMVKPKLYEKLFPLADLLFEQVLTPDMLLHDDVQNPVTHHTTVLRFLIEIGLGEGFSQRQIKICVALAILHDIFPVEKIPREVRMEAPPWQRKELEKKNRKNRIAHMKGGSDKAREILNSFPSSSSGLFFLKSESEKIFRVIRCHDDPSINVVIEYSNKLAVALREADRLWQMTEEGLRADLIRKGEKRITIDKLKRQARKNLKTWSEEKNLYEKSGHNSHLKCDFFRLKAGAKIAKRLKKQWDL